MRSGRDTPIFVDVSLRQVVKAGKYAFGLACLAFALQTLLFDAVDVSVSNPDRASLFRWLSLPDFLVSEQPAQPADDVFSEDHLLVMDRHLGGAPVGNSTHGSSGCWTGGHDPHELKETLAFCFFCFAVCCLLDHLNLLVPIAWRFPLSVVLFISGMACGSFFIYQSDKDWFPAGLVILSGGVKDTAYFDPHALLYIVLPPLLYESASSMQWHKLRKILPSAVLLAVPGVMLNTFFTGFFVKGVIRMDGQAPNWPTSWLLSSILSATDPVAVVSALAALGAPAKLSTIVEGESLLNDGSAVVLCYVFEDWVMGKNAPDSEKYCAGDPPGAGCVFVQFIHVAVGGAAIGVLAGLITYHWIGLARLRHSEALELGIILSAVYLVFYLAEAVKASGVLSTVSLGFIMTAKISSRLSHDARHGHHTLLHFIGYSCNQITFFASGVISARFVWGDTPCSHTGWKARPWLELFGLYIFIHITRGSVVLIFSPALKRMGYGMTNKEALIMVYGGLRGAVGLIMGLIVEHNSYIDPKISQMIAFHTSGIVLLTLFVNGSTVDGLYKRLDLYPKSDYRETQLCNTLAKVEAESTKIGIKAITKDWFFYNCFIKELLNCVPNFGHIAFDEANLPIPDGIEDVAITLNNLHPYAAQFRREQVSMLQNSGETHDTKWASRYEIGNARFMELLNSGKEVAFKKDQLTCLTAANRELIYEPPKLGGGTSAGLYVSGFPLAKLKKEEDDGFHFEVEISEIEGLQIIVGLLAESSEDVREVTASDDDQALGILINSIGYNCSNGNVARNGPAVNDMLETNFRPLQSGDVLSIKVERRPGGEWEIEFSLPAESMVISRTNFGPFSPEELYPALEFRPTFVWGKGGSASRSKSLSSGTGLGAGASHASRAFNAGGAASGAVVSASCNAVSGVINLVGMGRSAEKQEMDWVKSKFKAAAKASGGDDLEKDAFKQLVKELAEERGEGEPPTDKDLDAAFVLADEDEGGTVDEQEFIKLWRLIKSGDVKGLGASEGFFSSGQKNKKKQFRKSLSQMVVAQESEKAEEPLHWVKKKFKAAAQSSDSDDLEKDAFKQLVLALLAETGASEAPTDKDLDAAFVLADEDEGGTVDEQEFIKLWSLIKNGEVKGLGASEGFFSSKTSEKKKRFRKSLSQMFVAQDDDLDRADSEKGPSVAARLTLSFEMHPASDSESVNEMFSVLFNMLMNQYTSMHEDGTLCDKALFILKGSIGEAVDNSTGEVNCKRIDTFLVGLDTLKSSLAPFNAASGLIRAAKNKVVPGSDGGMCVRGLYEPVLLEYLVLRNEVRTTAVWDRVPHKWQRFRAMGYQSTRSKIEALWAFIEAHTKVIKESPAIERFPQLVECIKNVIVEAIHDLETLRDTQPARYFYCKHLLALRIVLTKRKEKIKKFMNAGLLSPGDAEALMDELWERIVSVDLWGPRKSNKNSVTVSKAWAWQKFEHQATLRKSLSKVNDADDLYEHDFQRKDTIRSEASSNPSPKSTQVKEKKFKEATSVGTHHKCRSVPEEEVAESAPRQPALQTNPSTQVSSISDAGLRDSAGAETAPPASAAVVPSTPSIEEVAVLAGQDISRDEAQPDSAHGWTPISISPHVSPPPTHAEAPSTRDPSADSAPEAAPPAAGDVAVVIER